MTDKVPDRLYRLLPEIYRIRDDESGVPLKALLAVIGREVAGLEDDITGLYNNLFIETCDEWVVPYIGDLLGARTLYSIPSADFSMRPYVANTLAYRRRKGTATVLEQLAYDVSGWQARVVEYFRLLAMTQHINHIRPDYHGLADMHNGEALSLLGGPFETTAHTVDVRHISTGRGRYNIPDIGIFLWRLESYPVKGATAARASTADKHWFTFSPVGLSAPLFNNPRTESEMTHIAEEINLPVELRRKALADELALCRADPGYQGVYFGDHPVFRIYQGGAEVFPQNIRICNLSGWQVPANPDNLTKVYADPVCGRLYFIQVPAQAVTVDYSYGFPGGIGGGPYDHRSAIASPDPVKDGEKEWDLSGTDPESIPVLLAKWRAWNTGKEDWKGIITLSGSRTYHDGTDLTIDLSGRKKGTLFIQAADEERPVIDGSIIIVGDNQNCSLVLSGLLVHGTVIADPGAFSRLQISHCTLTPGGRLDPATNSPVSHQPSLVVRPGQAPVTKVPEIILDHCITGDLRLNAETASLEIRDSIVQSATQQDILQVFTCSFTGPLADDFISSFESAIDKNPRLGTTISPSSVMVTGDQIVVVPAKDRAIPDVALPVIRQELRSIMEDVLHVSPAVFSLTSATTGIPFEVSAGTKPQKMKVRVTVRNEKTANSRDVSIQRDTINTGAGTAAWELLQAAIRAAGGGAKSVFSGVYVSCYNGSIIAFYPADPPDMPFEIIFGETNDDQVSVYELGLATGSSLAISAGNGRPGPGSVIERTTIFGEVRVKELQASGDIFNDIVTVEKNQAGCVRFSYVPPGSITPPCYRCQPVFAILQENARRDDQGRPALKSDEEAAIRARLVPSFTSAHYGNPAYCQLGRGCAQEICSGGEEGSEMGAFSLLLQPQREANLRAVLDEYLRFGLEAGIFYVT